MGKRNIIKNILLAQLLLLILRHTLKLIIFQNGREIINQDGKMKLSGGISGFIQDEQGFTAIELITVILIIGILLASVFAKYHDVKIGVSTTVCHTNQLALEKAETLYYTNCVLQRTTGHYATEIIDLVPYLVDRAIPHCPEDGTYILQEDGHAICSLPAHQR